MTHLFALVIGAVTALAPALTPASHAEQDTYIRFERDGYYGNVYLNKDGSYLIVQTGPDRSTHAFTGGWIGKGASGFCIRPDGATPGKCFEEMPGEVDRKVSVTSDLGEVYQVTLRRGR